MLPERLSVAYRRKVIIARKTNDGWEARAFDNKTPASQIRVGPASDDVILAVKTDLDREAAEERIRRGDDGFPTAEFVKKAFVRISPSDGQLAMLIAHLNAPDHVLTATELAVAAGKDSYEYPQHAVPHRADARHPDGHSVPSIGDWRDQAAARSSAAFPCSLPHICLIGDDGESPRPIQAIST